MLFNPFFFGVAWQTIPGKSLFAFLNPDSERVANLGAINGSEFHRLDRALDKFVLLDVHFLDR